MTTFSIKRLLHIAALAAALSLPSCRDEEIDRPDYTLAGADVSVTVAVKIPAMEKLTRAALDAGSLNRVESLWIRTYSADTGEANGEWTKISPETTDTEVAREVTLRTKSGYNYIVAVANVSASAVTKSDPTTTHKLSELLEKADSWGDFLDIAVVSPSGFSDVYAPETPVAMAGCYTDINAGGTHPEPTRTDEWQNRDFSPYFIPAQKETVDFTQGAIHLRRLVSHVTFNVSPGNENLDVTVNSYQVMNAPKYSWLYERPAKDGMATNFGDMATSAEDALNYYADVPQFGPQYVEKKDGVSTFDFWQGENKHTALASCREYTDRDKKTSGDPILFTSLTGDAWTPENEASYVVLSCTVDYKKTVQVNDKGEITPDGTEVFRTGQATYIVHLGYVKNGALPPDPRDFSCYRNVDYTYDITVNGLNDIRVEAYAEGDYPGEEGVVSDLQYATIEIDAHYHAFNIELTESELNDANFGFIITTYDNGRQISVSDDNRQITNGQNIDIIDEDGNVIDPKYYNWIELRPTSGQYTLAEYRPRYGNYSDGKTFLLSDLKGGWAGMTDEMKSSSGYYTVFVNEYTYEPMYTGTDGYADERMAAGAKRPEWMGYVNQNPRRFYVRVTRSVSEDNNSIYSRSKYGVAQKSIQSYYSDQKITEAKPAEGGSPAIPAGTAIGAERDNETEGLNLRHNFGGGNDPDNGRWNVAQWLDNNGSATSLSINNGSYTNRPIWSNFIDASSPMEVGAVGIDRAQGGPPLPERTISSKNPVKLPRVKLLTNGTSSFCDPQASGDYFIEAINACMSRNRDNNGNGRIEPDELRWYVPAMGKYLRLLLGDKSLSDPLMNFNEISALPQVNSNKNNWTTSGGSIINDYCSRYMFISSDNNTNVLWGMEGTSTSPYDKVLAWSGGHSRPWQVRCIRNLGTDLTSVSKSEKVTMAYVPDINNRTFRLTYYDSRSIRANTYAGNGNGSGEMPLHDISSAYNSVYKGFEYAAADITIPTEARPLTTDDTQFFDTYSRITDYINSNPCEKNTDYGAGWRIPNQRELTIMRNAGVFNSNEYHNNSTWITCTVNHFNRKTGNGNSGIADKLLMIVTKIQGTQLTRANMGYADSHGFYIRCVRDIE